MADSIKGNIVGVGEASPRGSEAKAIDADQNGVNGPNEAKATVDQNGMDGANEPGASPANKRGAGGAHKLGMDGAKEPAADATSVVMPKPRPKWHLGPHEQLLAWLIILLIICASLSGYLGGLLLLDASFFLLLWKSATIIFKKTEPWYRIYIGAALISSLVDACSTIIKYHTLSLDGVVRDAANQVLGHLDGLSILGIALDAVSTFGFAALLVISIYKLFVGLTKVRRVTRDTIFGGIYVYLLLAFLWDLVYLYISVWCPGAFKFPNQDRGQYDLMYFSLNTITTLGHGDIVPTQPLTMVLCNLEAIVGQIYPCVFIARLVSLYVIQDLENKQENEAEVK